MKKNIDYQKEFESLGDFWLQDDIETTYSGVLTYSPQKGIRLVLVWDYKKSNKFLSQSNQYYSFYGNIAEYGEMTLVGGLLLNSYCDFSERNKIEFDICYLINGAHIDIKDKCVREISFSFPGFENFCSHITEMQLYNKIPLMEHNINGDTYKILNNPSIVHSLETLLHPRNQDTVFINDIAQKISLHSLQVADFKPQFVISLKGYSTFWSIMKLAYTIEKLFSILLLTPIEADNISIKIEQNNKKCQVLHKQSDKTNKVKIGYHGHLPVNLDNIKDKFPNILSLWHDMIKDEFNITNIVITDKLLGRTEVGYQSFYIFIAFAEEWQLRYKKTMGLNAFLTENLLAENDFIYDKFIEYFPDAKNVSDISTKLGNIRNCIAHTKNKFNNEPQYKENKHILENEIAIRNLCEILFLLFVRTIHRKLGIERIQYQEDNFNRQLRLWNTIPCE